MGEVVSGADGRGAEFGGHLLEQMGVGVGPDEEGEVAVGYVAPSALDASLGGIGGADRERVCWWIWCTGWSIVGYDRIFDALDFTDPCELEGGIVILRWM